MSWGGHKPKTEPLNFIKFNNFININNLINFNINFINDHYLSCTDLQHLEN